MSNPSLVTDAAKALEDHNAIQGVLVGFDGFIDEILHLVDERESVDNFKRIETITDLADRIGKAAGKSANIEMVPSQVKLGGNGPIMANALVAQGYEIDYIGALGNGDIHPVFAPFVEQCRTVVSICEPGHTNALEFFDGKLMMGKMVHLKGVNWDALMKLAGRDEVLNMLKDVQLVGCVNWTMLPEMNSIFRGMIELLDELENRIHVFIDLTDPAKRTDTDILEALDLLRIMQGKADVILGLNEAESAQISDVLQLPVVDSLEERAQNIRTKLNLSIVVIHPVKGASVATEDGTWELVGPYTPKPKLTTGAGDNFNSGFCNGILSGLTPEQALASGVCTSGFYVRNCRSPQRKELIDFMRSWVDAGCGDME